MNGKHITKMTQEQFDLRFFNDMQKIYNVTFTGDTCQFSSKSNDIIHLDFFIQYIYEQYKVFQSYKMFLQDFIETLENGLSMYYFKVDLDNVMPIVKIRQFQVQNIQFVREEIDNSELDILYVQDSGSLYKFISQDDIEKDGIDIEELKQRAWNNLNKICIPLRQLENDLYCIFSFDNAATLAFSQGLQRQIESKLKSRDWIFSIPSSSTLLLSRFSLYNVGMLRAIQKVDNDYNKITNTIFRMKCGVLSVVNIDKLYKKQKPALSLI